MQAQWTISNLPLLTAENGHKTTDHSNRPLVVAALVAILLVSYFSSIFPYVASRSRFFNVPPLFFFLAKHFGTGVILSTAFVHLLQDAFTRLHDVRWFSYPHWPGFIVMSSILIIFILEYASSAYLEHLAQSHSSSHLQSSLTATKASPPLPSELNTPYLDDPEASVDSDDVSLSSSSSIITQQEMVSGTTASLTYSKKLLSVIILETGIVLHSIALGLTLAISSPTSSSSGSSTTPADYTTLLLAVLFHQTFEGLALGVRIATLSPTIDLDGRRVGWRMFCPPMLAFIFSIPIPVMMLLSLLTPLFKTDAAPETRGISSSISAGLLIHASCTELLPTIHSHGSKRQGAAIISLVLGAVGMAAVGW